MLQDESRGYLLSDLVYGQNYSVRLTALSSLNERQDEPKTSPVEISFSALHCRQVNGPNSLHCRTFVVD